MEKVHLKSREFQLPNLVDTQISNHRYPLLPIFLAISTYIINSYIMSLAIFSVVYFLNETCSLNLHYLMTCTQNTYFFLLDQVIIYYLLIKQKWFSGYS